MIVFRMRRVPYKQCVLFSDALPVNSAPLDFFSYVVTMFNWGSNLPSHKKLFGLQHSNSRPRFTGSLSGKCCLLTMLHWPVTQRKKTPDHQQLCTCLNWAWSHWAFPSVSTGLRVQSFNSVLMKKQLWWNTCTDRSGWATCRPHRWKWTKSVSSLWSTVGIHHETGDKLKAWIHSWRNITNANGHKVVLSLELMKMCESYAVAFTITRSQPN